jgi:hypothetical protein
MPLISHTPSLLPLPGTRASLTTLLIPNGSIRNAMYQHIIRWRGFLYRETKDEAILL